MTANELVEYIAEDLNLTSPESKQRILHELNVRYKQVTSSIGLVPTRRAEVSQAVTLNDRFVTFSNIERLDHVFYEIIENDGTVVIKTLRELNDDEVLEKTVHADPPTHYCLYTVQPSSVTIKLDCVPTVNRTLYAHGLANATTLTNNDIPAFPESFHDILIHGVRADEFRRKEKDSAAMTAEQMFLTRVSDLRMFLAKSAYMDLYNGKNANADGWWDTTSIYRRR